MKYFVPTLAIVGLASLASAADMDALVGEMPLIGEFSSPTYSGFLKVDKTTTKELHYIFTESLDNPTKDPVVIWFSGGPGCSSMLAMFMENGPWVIDDGEKNIQQNPWPWNMKANMLYIESPSGVGFSIADDKDPKQDDESQAADALAALLAWYDKFPEYMNNDLYVTGESYAGIYVPYLAAYALTHNEAQAKLQPPGPMIPITGIAVGNGATDFHFDVWPTYPDVVHGMSLIPSSLHSDFAQHNCVRYFMDVFPEEGIQGLCDPLWTELNSLTTEILNWYDLYRPKYDVTYPQKKMTEEERTRTVEIDGEIKTYKVGMTMEEYTPWMKQGRGEAAPTSWPLNIFISEYLNMNDVRTALHIPAANPAWSMCSQTVQENYSPLQQGSIFQYPILKAAGIKMMFYSGDTDGAVTHWGTRKWIETLNWKVMTETTPWYVDNQFNGEITKYDGLTFATIHGVGHMAPQWKRFEVTHLLNAFIRDEDMYNFYKPDYYGPKKGSGAFDE